MKSEQNELVLQKYFSFVDWNDKWLMKLNASKCKVMYIISMVLRMVNKAAYALFAVHVGYLMTMMGVSG